MSIAAGLARGWASWRREQPMIRNPYTQSLQDRVRWIGMPIELASGTRITHNIFSPFGFYLGMVIRGARPSQAFVIPPGCSEETAIDVTFFWQLPRSNAFIHYEMGAVLPDRHISITFGAWHPVEIHVRLYYLAFAGVH